MTNITFRDKEVRNPLLRALCALVVCFGVFVILPVAVIASLPLHVLLRLFGRRGFATISESGGIIYEISISGFKRAA